MSQSVSSMPAVPDEVTRIAGVMRGYPAPWSLCGGWAVDAWLGRITREHGDVDISVFAQDGPALFAHLQGWQLVAHETGGDGGTSELWDGARPLSLPAHLHGRPPELTGAMPARVDNAAAQGFGLDIQVDDRTGGEWVLHREPRVALPLKDAVVESPWGLPTAAPEALLFFKSRDLRRRDKLDFAALLPRLSAEQRAWLRDAIARAGHPWLRELGGA